MILQVPAAALFAHHGGFGINVNPFETNLINLIIVIGVLVWFLRGFLGGMLERRRQTILADLSDAEDRLTRATAELTRAQAEAIATREKARRDIESEKDRALSAIKTEAERLGSLIVDRLLAAS
jgi:F-type H+-transporting ATPase subunit b